MNRIFQYVIGGLFMAIAAITVGHTDPKIQTVTTKNGITAWLVESHSIPMISMEFSFRAGTAFEPANKSGVAAMLAGMMDEGAGDLDATAFQQAMEDIGARFGAGADTLDFNVNLSTLTENRHDAFKLLKLALEKPRFDTDALERIRDATMAGLRQEQENPSAVAARAFDTALFGTHPYGRPVDGTLKSVPTLTQADVAAFYNTHMTKANMVVSVVGDITPAELQTVLDDVLGNLPAGTTRNAIAAAPKAITPQVVKVERDIPQASVMFGHLGISRDDPLYFPALVLNDILGGGGFRSRFMNEVREKRGLAYGAYSSFVPMPFAGTFVAQVQPKNDKVHESVAIMKEQMALLATEGATKQEYDDAISYLTGSFPLRLDSNGKILGYLST
ncbi:MAG: pitrilysin family protein, partial [Alphaproteobacteria bacterium]